MNSTFVLGSSVNQKGSINNLQEPRIYLFSGEYQEYWKGFENTEGPLKVREGKQKYR